METGENKLLSRINALAARQLDESMTPAELNELEALLLENAAARRAYVHYFQDTACLRWLCLEELSDSADTMKSLPDSPRSRTPRRRDAWIFFGSIACLAAMLTASLLYPSWRRSPDDHAGIAEADGTLAPVEIGLLDHEPKTDAPQPMQVATVTGLGSVRWAVPEESQTRLLSRCAVGDVIKFKEGAIELTFDAGAQVTVFGPADFTITSATSMQCRTGRVTALVDERGKGFVVLTPQAKVVDLGTQFGLNISETGETEVVVFQGSVDMSPADGDDDQPRRLSQGDAMVLKRSGQFERLVSIHRNDFLTTAESIRQQSTEPVIADIQDNIRSADGAKSYHIVRGGLQEDALCFVDRSHQWNGVDRSGLPKFLQGADYVMPFNDDKFVGTLELKLHLLRPSDLYIFIDNNMEVPDWVRKDFVDTGVDIGLDGATTEWHKTHSLAEGAGESVDFYFSVWKREVKKAGIVTLGSVNPPQPGTRSYGFNMYGIAAVAKE